MVAELGLVVRKIYRTVKILERKENVLPPGRRPHTPTSVILDLMKDKGIHAHYIKFINMLLVR